MDSVVAVAFAPPPEPFELPNSAVFSNCDKEIRSPVFLFLKILFLPAPEISLLVSPFFSKRAFSISGYKNS